MNIVFSLNLTTERAKGEKVAVFTALPSNFVKVDFVGSHLEFNFTSPEYMKASYFLHQRLYGVKTVDLVVNYKYQV